MSQSSTLNYSVAIQPQVPVALKRTSQITLAIALLVVGTLATALFFFAMPVWDDLIRATRPTEVGWWGYVIDFVYKHWQGRWASCGLESFILPRVDITRFYWVLIGAVAFIDAVAAYALCRWYTPTCTRATSAVVAACLLALLWTGMDSVGETVYWFTGAVENAMVYALAILLLLALIRLPGPATFSPIKRISIVIALSIAAICICGLHELYGMMFCLALALGTFASLSNPKTDRAAWVAVTLAAITGLFIVALAPGNSARFNSVGPHARHFFYDLQVALSQVKHFGIHWILDPKLLAISCLVITNPIFRARQAPSDFPWRWAIPMVWLIMLAAGFFAPSWAFGNWMPPRTISGIYIIFVLGWLIILHLWAPRLLPRLNRGSEIARAVAVIVFSISLFLPGSAYAAAHDFYHRILPWHRAIEQRYAILRKAKGTDAVVPLLPKPPWILPNGEIVNDPTDYHNWGTSTYFHLRSIRFMPPGGQLPPPPDHPTRAPAAGMNS